MNYLCIDYGLKHLGLAHATTTIAEPLETIPTQDSLNPILSLIDSRAIEKIIIGLPTGHIAPKVEAFAENLKQHTSVPIVFHDETLTSHEARQKLTTAKKSKRALDHHFAAALILQDYLDFNS